MPAPAVPARRRKNVAHTVRSPAGALARPALRAPPGSAGGSPLRRRRVARPLAISASTSPRRIGCGRSGPRSRGGAVGPPPARRRPASTDAAAHGTRRLARVGRLSRAAKASPTRSLWGLWAPSNSGSSRATSEPTARLGIPEHPSAAVAALCATRGPACRSSEAPRSKSGPRRRLARRATRRCSAPRRLARGSPRRPTASRRRSPGRRPPSGKSTRGSRTSRTPEKGTTPPPPGGRASGRRARGGRCGRPRCLRARAGTRARTPCRRRRGASRSSAAASARPSGRRCRTAT